MLFCESSTFEHGREHGREPHLIRGDIDASGSPHGFLALELDMAVFEHNSTFGTLCSTHTTDEKCQEATIH